MSVMKVVALSVLSLAVLTGCQSLNKGVEKVKSTSANVISTLSSEGIDYTKTSYANERSMTMAGVNYPIGETSARLLVNSTKSAPELVADIYDGKGDKAVAGYKIMVINRTSSIFAEARKTDMGVMEGRTVHRGSKALIGIPVVAGKADLSKAVLLDLDIIYDDPTASVAEGKLIKERGTKLTKAGVVVNDKKVTVRSLTLPNFKSGENAGGGIDFTASATIEGKAVTTGANSAFEIFYVATPDNSRGFTQ